MPNLQLHMYRVAGVADWICERLVQHGVPVERENAVTTCLVHDLGNIVKFDLAYFPEFLEPQGLEYWQAVQADTKARFGANAHQVTNAMIREIGMPERIVELADAISFNRAKQTLASEDWTAKVCAYADMRVAPHGVVSMKERLEDGFKRYEQRGATSSFSFVIGSYLKKLEQQLRSAGSFQPEEITDSNIKIDWSDIEIS